MAAPVVFWLAGTGLIGLVAEASWWVASVNIMPLPGSSLAFMVWQGFLPLLPSMFVVALFALLDTQPPRRIVWFSALWGAFCGVALLPVMYFTSDDERFLPPLAIVGLAALTSLGFLVRCVVLARQPDACEPRHG